MEFETKILASLGTFTSTTRLYELRLKEGNVSTSDPLVEAFLAVDEVQAMGARDVIVLSSGGELPLHTLLGQQASLEISLANGTRTAFTGLVSEAAMLGSTGSLVRYRLRLSSFLWPLSQSRNNCVWQDKSIIEIVESVLLRYPDYADWRWSDDVPQFMGGARPRSYCIQYRETDLEFITRLLDSEGLGWFMEENADSVAGHRMVLFADSTQSTAFAEDATSHDSVAGQGIRYHNARAGETQDTIQALASSTSLGAASVTMLSYDYKAKKSVAASVPTNQQVDSLHAPKLESFDTPGLYAYANAQEAQHYARLRMEAMEAANQRWQARSTVRTLRPGTHFSLTQGPLSGHGDTTPVYNVLRVVSMGINNLPGSAIDGLAELFGPIPELLEECMQQMTGREPSDAATRLGGIDTAAQPGFGLADLIKQAYSTGYANRVDMMDATLPWRPAVTEDNGAMLLAVASAPGSQSAIVVGSDGQSSANGPDELYCDKLGRVRIRFHWQGDQNDASASCWVRVAQRSAGGGMGAQFLPRIGQEVLVTFLENNIDRPLILGALYNGQGEGGQLPTPGGRSDQEADLTVFAQASDHAIAAQANLAGGNSPHWHGASGDSAGQRNSAAQSGMRSKEFGGNGYNQLLFDDTDQQGRTGLKSTQAATELTLGHMLHSADNFRGSFRGLGAELRTDAYGAVRAGTGLLLSTFAGTHSATEREPAGDNAPALAHMKQAMLLAQSFNTTAVTHQTVALAGQVGSTKKDSSTIDPKAAPVKALYTSVAGMLGRENMDSASADAAAKATAPADGKLPHHADAMIALSAKAGLAIVAGQDTQFAIGETATFMAGLDSQIFGGGELRAHSSQAIGLLAGVMKPGDAGAGLQMISAQQPIDFQAQSDILNVQAHDDINVISANAHIDWAAAKSIRLSTAGGANITISGGDITVQCPGKITIKAGKKSFLGPENLNYALPKLPRSALQPRPLKFNLQLADTPGVDAHVLANTPWVISYGKRPEGMAFISQDHVVAQGKTDMNGKILLSSEEEKKLAEIYAANPDHTFIAYPGHITKLNVATESAEWDDQTRLMHALDAANFSADLHRSKLAEAAQAQSRYAKDAMEAGTSTDIFKKLKQ